MTFGWQDYINNASERPQSTNVKFQFKMRTLNVFVLGILHNIYMDLYMLFVNILHG